jgi:acetyl esterase/lipase
MAPRLALLNLCAAVAIAGGSLVLGAEPHSEANVTYVTRAGANGPTELQMNIVVPGGPAAKRPCIVCIHGGGWAAGKRQDLDELTRQLSTQGFVAATVSYRFAPAEHFPAQIMDCAEAVRFLRVNAERFGIDPDKIGAVGFSAGGHLSMMLGVGDAGDGLGIEGEAGKPSGKVNAVVSFFGPTLLGASDFSPQTTKILDGLIGAEAEGRADRARAASPVTYLTKGDAPLLLLQGTADPLVPATQATLMVDAMAKAGVAGRAEIIAGAGHGWNGAELERTLKETVEFFKAELHVKQTAAAPAGPVKLAVTVNSDEAPDLKEWGEKAKALCEEWYPRLLKEYPSEGFKPRESLTIVFEKTMKVPATTGGGKMSVNAEYVRSHPGDVGMVIHELFHVVQSYPRQKADMGWLTEGIADYVRFWEFEPQTHQRQINKEKASYRNSYRVTAAFLGWVESKTPGSVAKLNAQLRKGGRDETVFKDVVGTDVDELWKGFVEAGAPSEPARK